MFQRDCRFQINFSEVFHFLKKVPFWRLETDAPELYFFSNIEEMKVSKITHPLVFSTYVRGDWPHSEVALLAESKDGCTFLDQHQTAYFWFSQANQRRKYLEAYFNILQMLRESEGCNTRLYLI